MSHTIIIAEAGVNHNGDLELAKELVDVAADCRADYVKFQAFKADKLVSIQSPKAAYQLQNTGGEESQYDMIRRLELDEKAHKELIAHCALKGIGFLSSPFDEDSLRLLIGLNLDYIKIPSGEITNLPFLEELGLSAVPVILSTGMSNLNEIGQALEVLTKGPRTREDVTVLHCNTDYPTAYQDVNLRAMMTISEHFGVKAGYSDHTLGIEVPIAAIALGATCIEKHFTLDRNMPGPDHRASLEPSELKDMVTSIRNIEVSMGSALKKPTKSELINLPVARKSIHTKGVLEEGHILTQDDLVMKRPGDGISPMDYKSLIGRQLKQNLAAGTKLHTNHLK